MTVVELLVLGVLAFAAVVVFAVLLSVLGSVLWLVALPFRILGWALKGLALLIALPFVALFGLLAFVVMGGGMLVFLAPFIPLALIALGASWLVRRSRVAAAPIAH